MMGQQPRTESLFYRNRWLFTIWTIAGHRLVVDRIPALSWSSHPDGSVEFVNQRRREYAGLSPEESQCSGWQVAIHPEHSPADGQPTCHAKPDAINFY